MLKDKTNKEIIEYVKNFDGYLLTNNERDVSQSDFKARIMPWTTLRAAATRDMVGYFAFEATGGASVHVDLMKKQINPFEKLRLIRKSMPNTLIQAGVRSQNLFGYRPYSENVIRKVISQFAKYVDVFRVYDFMNHIPNMKVVGEEVLKAGKVFMPSLCFGIGVDHTNEFYLSKVQEIVNLFGSDLILSIKNFSAVGTPERISDLIKVIRSEFPEIPLAYHGHNTDGNDLARMVAAIKAGVKIVEVCDHGYGCWYSQAPALSLIQLLEEYNIKPKKLNIDAIIESSEIIKLERRYYAEFESPFRGIDPLAHAHRLSGGALSMAYEQAEKLGLLSRINEIFKELSMVIMELGDIWPITPGSQILWSTAVSNILYGRYEQPSDDLKRLLVGGYGPFPFYDPPEWIYEKVFKKELKSKSSLKKDLKSEDIKKREKEFENQLNYQPSDEDLALYLLFPRDFVEFVKFEEKFGRTWLLPPDIWFHKGRFENGKRISFLDDRGKHHWIDIISTQHFENTVKTSCLVDHHFKTYTITIKNEQKT